MTDRLAPETVLPETVFVVDDDPSVLRALGRLLKSAGLTVALFALPADFLAQQNPAVAGCLVLDVMMPELTGPQVMQSLRRSGNPLPVIFLTGHGDIPMTVRAMKAGAVDFLAKPCRDEELLAAVAAALALDRQLRRQRADERAAADLIATLTPREREVMLGVVAGKTNRSIADDLGTAEKTVKVHRGRVMGKLGVASVADLVRLNERAGDSTTARG